MIINNLQINLVNFSKKIVLQKETFFQNKERILNFAAGSQDSCFVSVLFMVRRCAVVFDCFHVLYTFLPFFFGFIVLKMDKRKYRVSKHVVHNNNTINFQNNP